jgi:hypothetical protein
MQPYDFERTVRSQWATLCPRSYCDESLCKCQGWGSNRNGARENGEVGWGISSYAIWGICTARVVEEVEGGFVSNSANGEKNFQDTGHVANAVQRGWLKTYSILTRSYSQPAYITIALFSPNIVRYSFRSELGEERFPLLWTHRWDDWAISSEKSGCLRPEFRRRFRMAGRLPRPPPSRDTVEEERRTPANGRP